SQLYAPKFITRRGAELAEDRPVAPNVYSGAIQQFNKLQAAPPAARAKAPQNSGVAGLDALQQRVTVEPDAPVAQSSTIAQTASGQEIADLFQYSIATPVTVRKGESAMLPFLQQKITGRKLVIYSDPNRPNPFTAGELTNSTGKTLDGGPITVYDAGAYAGEALVETIKNSDKRFI